MKKAKSKLKKKPAGRAKKPSAVVLSRPPPVSVQPRPMSNLERQRKFVESGSEIGPLPECEDPERRESCRNDLALYMRTYEGHIFTRPMCGDILAAVKDLEKAILSHGQNAQALPRAMGKTTIGESAMRWAILYGHRRFVVIIAATARAADKVCKNIKRQLEINRLLLQDFPEVVYPIRMLQGHSQRASTQTIGGEFTNLIWKKSEIVFPTIPGSCASGSSIITAGITGAIRGTKDDTMRPDFVFMDDPQTRESSASEVQTTELENIILGDIMGLAGHTKRISAYMACTIIRRGDLADRMTNRERHPDWGGKRGMLVSIWPENKKLWDEYLQIWEEDNMAGDHTTKRATDFYRQNKVAMDAGAKVADPGLFDPGIELSAIQHAVNLRAAVKDPAFFSEYQNDPESAAVNSYFISTDLVAAKVNSYERWTAPAEAVEFCAHTDINYSGLHWSITWNDRNFSWGVLAYGRIPERGVLVERGANEVEAKSMVAAGLSQYLDLITMAKIIRGSGTPAAVGIGGVDAGFMTDTVAQLCRRDPRAVRLLIPTKGFSSTRYRPEAGKTLQRWERAHLSESQVAGRFVAFDSDYWRSTMQRAFLTEIGAPGSGTLHALPHGASHTSYAQHIAAEQLAELYTSKTGGQAFRWTHEPGAVWDWADSLVGCLVMAAARGHRTTAAGLAKAGPPPPQRRMVERRKPKVKQE